jgi:hypothetical protein
MKHLGLKKTLLFITTLDPEITYRVQRSVTECGVLLKASTTLINPYN